MTVSTRHKIAYSAAILALSVAGTAAFAGDGKDRGSRSYSSPPHTQPAQRPHKQSPVIVPGVSVKAPGVVVNQGSVVNQQTFINRGVTGGGVLTGRPGLVGGGGFGVSGAGPVAPSTLNGLNVLGADQSVVETITERVPVTEETCAPTVQTQSVVRPVQAVCLDDRGTPHPASRISADERVAETYDGEVFRCLAGTHMQVTTGRIVDGRASFAQGQTFSCRKGEALVQRNGALVCAVASPQRDCNERSLLRRHGPGIKLIRQTVNEETCVPQRRTVLKTITREVETLQPNENGPIIFDGGVGQTVY